MVIVVVDSSFWRDRLGLTCKVSIPTSKSVSEWDEVKWKLNLNYLWNDKFSSLYNKVVIIARIIDDILCGALSN